MRIRRLDRQLGAIVVRDELNAKIRQVQRLAAHSLAPGTREPLAGLLSEMHTLAGWQALDLGDMIRRLATLRTLPVRSRPIRLHPARIARCRRTSIRPHRRRSDPRRGRPTRRCPAPRRHQPHHRVLRAWLAAAHGEALAAHGDRTASLHAFDRAAELLPE